MLVFWGYMIKTNPICIYNNNVNLIKSSVFNLPRITSLIDYIKARETNKEALTESDYNLIMTSIIPYYFNYNNGWILGGEVWNRDLSVKRGRIDFVVFWINGNNFTYPGKPIGYPLPYAMYEGKRRYGKTWISLIGDQVYKECEGAGTINGKIWVICQIGFEMCIFRYDESRYVYPGFGSDNFDHFSPLNLNGFFFLNRTWFMRNIKYISESINPTTDIIQVIQWRLDNRAHYQWIHDMFVYITQNKV